jgi:hypothetical protein
MLKHSVRPGPALAVLAAAIVAGPVRAADELHTPYDLQIVLHVADHRLLGEVFRDRVTRELGDGLRTALGDLARVSVVHKHPRLADVLRLGLDKALDGWVERSGVKTHFVLIDIAGADYRIQARQHDGLTGRAGRVVRRDHTPDRDFVARAAALLVAHDFGLVGTVLTNPDPQERVKVELKAGALGSLARWLRPGQVFEIVSPTGTTALPWALLQVQEPPAEEARDGLVQCRLLHRYQLPNITGHRCLLLGTTRAPLRLHFVLDKGRGVQAPLDRTLQLAFRRKGFQGEETTRLTKSTDSSGWVDTSRDGDKGTFEDVAFVSVTGGMPPPLPHIPVAIVDDRPIVVPVSVTASPGGVLASRRATWERNVADSYLLQVYLFKEIRELGAQPEGRVKAVERAKFGLQRTREDYESLRAERAALEREAGTAGGGGLDPRWVQRLEDLQKGEAILQSFLEKQTQINQEENDPKKKEWNSQVAQAQFLEKEYEVGQAIAIYEKVLKEGLDNAALRKYVEELKAQWQVKDDKHGEARAFIYNVWPTLDNAGLKERLPEAQQAFAECRRVKDLISPRKLFKVTEAHAVRLKNELDRLHPELEIDDEKPAQLIREVTPGLTKLASDIAVYFQKQQAP